MARHNRPFRIETMMAGTDTSALGTRDAAGHDPRIDRILEVVESLHLAADLPAPAPSACQETHGRRIEEARALKQELDAIHSAIAETKREIATMHVSGPGGADMARVAGELDAVVAGTEQATETILAAAEAIDDGAGNLAARLSGDDREIATDIQERVVAIFEACNFQDITGQRIGKVVKTLGFVEDRVARMMEIWGGIEAFASIEPDSPLAPAGDAALLNGPALETDADTASQDDIDALFA